MKDKLDLSIKDLTSAKGQIIGTWAMGVFSPSTEFDLNTKGFYFFLDPRANVCLARFFVGEQRSAQGFAAVLTHIRLRRSRVAELMMIPEKTGNLMVVHVPVVRMKYLTSAFAKGRIAKAFSRTLSDPYQNMSQVNRQLNDIFKFKLQKY